MRKILFLTLAIVCGVAFSDGWAKRPKKNQQTKELTAAERDSVIKALEEEMKAWEAERERQKEEARAQLEALKEEIQSAQEEMKTDFPCMEEAVSNDEYFAAWGEGTGMSNVDAMMRAQHNAIFNLSSILSQNGYSTDSIPDPEIICRTINRDKYGNIIYYIALKVNKSNLQKK
ncbi:MAG: hypothetical protein KBT27_11505 [Prevotellaceae bacterium]|nr:hypothetical protein [Candidatus Faecinaster equi]